MRRGNFLLFRVKEAENDAFLDLSYVRETVSLFLENTFPSHYDWLLLFGAHEASTMHLDSSRGDQEQQRAVGSQMNPDWIRVAQLGYTKKN